MQRFVALALAAAAAVLMSGCALVGHHSVPVENGGVRTTVGLLAVDAIGDGYPMIPLYSSTAFGKK